MTRRGREKDGEGALGMTRGREKDGEEGAERTIWRKQTLSQGLWIPAYAGMTGGGAGMTRRGRWNDEEGALE